MTNVTVRLFSILRHRGDDIVDQLEVELPEGSQVSDVLRTLRVPTELSIILVLNGDLVRENALLSEGDQIAIIPAIAGG